MRYLSKYLYSLILVFTLVSFSSITLCQKDTGKEKNSADSSDKKISLYAGADYGSNFIYMGSTISGNLPYYSTSLTLATAGNFYFTASASHISKTSPFAAFYSTSAGYRHVVNDWLDYSADLSFYYTPVSLRETLFNNFAMVNISGGFDWKLIYTKLILSGLRSKDNSGYIQFRNSHYFQTGQFFKGKAFLSVDPAVNLLFGRLVEIETSAGTSKSGNAPPFVQLKKKQTGTVYTYSYFFGMMDTEFSLPVTINFKNCSIEAETVYILPVHLNADYPSPKGFSFNLTAYIKIL